MSVQTDFIILQGNDTSDTVRLALRTEGGKREVSYWVGNFPVERVRPRYFINHLESLWGCSHPTIDLANRWLLSHGVRT